MVCYFFIFSDHQWLNVFPSGASIAALQPALSTTGLSSSTLTSSTSKPPFSSRRCTMRVVLVPPLSTRSLMPAGARSTTCSPSSSACAQTTSLTLSSAVLSVSVALSCTNFPHIRVSCASLILLYFLRNCTGPVSNLVDFVPLLQHLPTGLRTRAQNLHNDLVETYGGMIADIDARMRRGEDVPDCLAKTMLETREEEQLDDLDMAILASAFMIGGVETVSFSIDFPL